MLRAVADTHVVIAEKGRISEATLARVVKELEAEDALC